MQTSDMGIQLITNFEGLYLNAYDDGTGVATIGFGTIAYPDGTKVQMGDGPITKDQAIQYLQFELKDKEDCVNDMVNVDLNQAQFDACISFAYNLGCGALHGSTLLKLINQSDFDDCPAEFLKWDRAGGHVMAGLLRRRHAEAYLFQYGQLKFDGFQSITAHFRAFIKNAMQGFKPDHNHPYNVPMHMVRGL